MRKDIWDEKISLEDLSLWDENARFSDKYFNRDEKELIAHFCNIKNFEIQKFSREIVKDLDLPQMEKLIIYREDRRNIVLEGNRRVAVYKLLNNPGLAPNDTLRKFFEEHKNKTTVRGDFLFDCIVTSEISEGHRYIERKHLRRNNEVAWGTQERANYKVRRGSATQKEKFKTAIAKIVRELDLPEELKENILGPRFVTTFWRIIDSSVAWEKYGFSVNKNGDLEIKDKSFPKHLRIIIWNILQKEDFGGNKIDSRSLNTNKEKTEYLDSISSEDFRKVSDEVGEHTKKNLFGKESVELPKAPVNLRKTPITSHKDVIFGRKLVLRTGSINDLYRAVDLIYEQNKSNEKNLSTVFPILGMSLRLILEVGAKEYYKEHDPHKAGDFFEDFLKLAKLEFKNTNNEKHVNYLSLTTDWLSGKYNVEGVLHNWAHGKLPTNKSEVLKTSQIVGDILTIFFSKNK